MSFPYRKKRKPKPRTLKAFSLYWEVNWGSFSKFSSNLSLVSLPFHLFWYCSFTQSEPEQKMWEKEVKGRTERAKRKAKWHGHLCPLAKGWTLSILPSLGCRWVRSLNSQTKYFQAWGPYVSACYHGGLQRRRPGQGWSRWPELTGTSWPQAWSPISKLVRRQVQKH